jgi:hypothetical protein
VRSRSPFITKVFPDHAIIGKMLAGGRVSFTPCHHLHCLSKQNSKRIPKNHKNILLVAVTAQECLSNYKPIITQTQKIV